jgi:hypothetical protein
LEGQVWLHAPCNLDFFKNLHSKGQGLKLAHPRGEGPTPQKILSGMEVCLSTPYLFSRDLNPFGSKLLYCMFITVTYTL